MLYQLAHVALFSDTYTPFITVKVLTLTCTCMQSVDLHVHVHVQYLYTVYGFIDNSGSELSVVPSHNAKQCYLLEHKLHCSHFLASVAQHTVLSFIAFSVTIMYRCQMHLGDSHIS